MAAPSPVRGAVTGARTRAPNGLCGPDLRLLSVPRYLGPLTSAPLNACLTIEIFGERSASDGLRMLINEVCSKTAIKMDADAVGGQVATETVCFPLR